ncbi:MAG: DUF4255 domain-containing protein [Anaerolineae bacterium]|nr:DUF4255 domain-containing protein [Anaerolineae bacterium]
MLNETLVFLKNRLNGHLNSGRNPEESREDQVVFLDGQNLEPLIFKLGAVSVLLINIEEENTLRAPDPHIRISPDGTRQKIQPEIRLNLYVLFVARFKQYEESLRYLSLIIQYFQKHRLLNHHNAPELNENIDQLVMELITLPLSEQNNVWNALRVTYQPSVLYKVKMIVFQDEDALGRPEIKEKTIKASP